MTYDRVFGNARHYLGEVLSKPVDLLILDMGTNDLCNQTGTPETVVGRAIEFLSQICAGENGPRQIRILSVLQRSKINRRGQVTVPTFSHRVKKFNSQLALKVESLFSHVRMYPQRRLNRPKYPVDGCHLNEEGMERYCRGLRETILRYKQ